MLVVERDVFRLRCFLQAQSQLPSETENKIDAEREAIPRFQEMKNRRKGYNKREKAEKNRHRDVTPARIPSKLATLNFHSHEHPLLAGHVQILGPVVQRRHFEANPLEAPGQLQRLVRWDATVETGDNVGAFQGPVGEFNKSHESSLQISSHHTFNVEEDEEGLLPSVVCNEGTKARAAGIVPQLHPSINLEAALAASNFKTVFRRRGADRELHIRWRRLHERRSHAAIATVVIIDGVCVKATSQAGAMHRSGPLTKEYRLHGLTEEPLTFFPDLDGCPPSPAGAAVRMRQTAAGILGALLLLLGQKSKLVGRVERSEGGTCWGGWET